MLWPVLLGSAPTPAPWVVGGQVAARLRWCDSPDLPDELLVHDLAVHASVLRGDAGKAWAQLIRVGQMFATRPGHQQTGEITLSGCLGYDGYFESNDTLPATAGIVRRIRVVMDLHDRGADRWIPRRGAVHTMDVPDASPHRLRDDASRDDDPSPDWQHGRDSGVFLSPEQYFALYRDGLPAEQWLARGFLVDLDVPGPDHGVRLPSAGGL